MNLPVKVIVRFEARVEAQAAFAQLMAQVKMDLPQVPGCTGVRLFTGHEAPNVFVLLEDWQSAAQHQAHLAQVKASGAWEQIAAHLAAEPLSLYCNEA